MRTSVVRLFVPAETEAHAGREVHGLVEEVRSGRRASFGSRPELLAFFADRTADEPAQFTDQREET